MAIPESVQPFVESQSVSSAAAEWVWRGIRLAPVRHLLAAGVLLVLWADIARQGLWPGLPGPLDAAASFGAYALVLVAGVALGALVYRARPVRVAAAQAAPD